MLKPQRELFLIFIELERWSNNKRWRFEEGRDELQESSFHSGLNTAYRGVVTFHFTDCTFQELLTTYKCLLKAFTRQYGNLNSREAYLYGQQVGMQAIIKLLERACALPIEAYYMTRQIIVRKP